MYTLEEVHTRTATNNKRSSGSLGSVVNYQEQAYDQINSESIIHVFAVKFLVQNSEVVFENHLSIISNFVTAPPVSSHSEQKPK